MKLYSVNAGYFKLDGGAMFGVVPKSIWNKLNPADNNNMCAWALRCLLIEDGNRLILIDNGMGNKQDAKFFGHYYLHGDDSLEKSLATHGFSKDDITDVFLTHLHFDHCGGSIERQGDELVPAFKHATFWSTKLHWDWAVTPNKRERASFLKENILPIQETGQLNFIPHPIEVESKPGEWMSYPPGLVTAAFTDTISVKFTEGHTRSMMLPVIHYKGQTIVYMADLLPSAAHIPLPYVMGYDMFPFTTLNEKEAFLQEAVDNNYTLFFEHDATIECCNLQQTEKGIRMKDSFKLADL
jgi:glyoxylase-like metal-dependent hydrolase (beta-lactamase superfamily II)